MAILLRLCWVQTKPASSHNSASVRILDFRYFLIQFLWKNVFNLLFTGFLFEYVSGANFLGEIVEWIGFHVACYNLPSLAFAVFTLCNIGPRAFHHHRWHSHCLAHLVRLRPFLIVISPFANFVVVVVFFLTFSIFIFSRTNFNQTWHNASLVEWNRPRARIKQWSRCGLSIPPL